MLRLLSEEVGWIWSAGPCCPDFMALSTLLILLGSWRAFKCDKFCDPLCCREFRNGGEKDGHDYNHIHLCVCVWVCVCVLYVVLSGS